MRLLKTITYIKAKMKKQIKIRLRGKEKNSAYVIIILMIIFLASCQKEIPDSIEPMVPSTITFQKTYGGSNDEYIGNVQPTNDSGYVIIGTTRSYGAGDGDIYIIKVDAHGNIQWTKTYGTLYFEAGCNIKQTKDGGYILSGAGDLENYILVKIDAEGNLQWNKNYGYFVGVNYGVQLTDDGGYIIVGSTDNSVIGTGIGRTLCIKTDENGNILWCKKYSVGGGVSIAKTPDGGYAIAGEYDFGYGGSGTQLIKIDAHGNLLWSRGYGGAGTSGGPLYPLSMKRTTEGGFIITGLADNYSIGNNYDVYVIKPDASGNRIWFKTYGGVNFDGAWEIEETSDGGYIFSGNSGNYGEGHVLVIKIDRSGEVTWSKVYGVGKEPYSYVHQAKDGGFIIASQTSGVGAGGSDLYLIKTDKNGKVGCYENPFSTIITTPAVLETNPHVDILIGSIFFNVNYRIGSGGKETTLCHK
jgi:hypothetical protein